MKNFFRTIFGSNDEESIEIPTKPLQKANGEVREIEEILHLDPPQLIVGCAQSVGLQRDHNEDALFTLTTSLTGENGNLPFGLFIVADGMGGHQFGEVASGIAVRILASYVVEKMYLSLLSLEPKSPEEPLREIMADGVEAAHKAIIKSVSGGGTTLTSALVLGDKMILAHVGDSRAYTLRKNGDIKALTRDHSLVNRLVELGQLTNEEAAIHPQRNVLYRALGQGEPFDTDIDTVNLEGVEYVLICSDGLWNVVSEEEISTLVKNSSKPEQACQKLIDAANEAGGPDNITAVLIRIPS